MYVYNIWRVFNKLSTSVSFQAWHSTCRYGHVLTCSSHIHKSFWRKCWQWEDGKCNGVRVYNEHEGFGASFHDKIPRKGREEADRNPWRDECCIIGDVWPSFYQVNFGPSNLSVVGNRLKMIHVQVCQWKQHVPKSEAHDFAKRSSR